MARVSASSDVDLDTLWQAFHDAVNMTSRELRDWLQTQSASEGSEEFADQSGTDLGRGVLAVLGKRKTDLTDDDLAVMRRVVDRVASLRGESEEPTPGGNDRWRRRLMNIGHDPLKPA